LTSGPIYVLVLFMDGMSPPSHAKELPSPNPEAAERRARHLRILAELADIGMELVQQVRLQALEEDAPGGADPVLAFTRLAKAVRQTVALEARVAAGGFDSVQPVSRASRSDPAARSRARQVKERVRRSVEEAIAFEAEGDDTEDLLRDLHERLDDPAFEDEFDGQPIGIIVASICAALGVQANLKAFSDAELGFTPESMRLAGLAIAKAAADVAAGVPVADGAGLPSWDKRAGTGLDPP
jgi:hypothetical protein